MAATFLAAAVAVAVAKAALPSDPLIKRAVFEEVGLPSAWELTTGSPNVVIAVVDSGVDGSHPDLAGAVDRGYDFVDGDVDAGDVNGHGTAVAGIAAARANNGLGGAGVCWQCRILPLRVLGPEGFALKTTMATAIDYAVDHGAAVVNVSLYGEDENALLEDAIHRARAAGVLVVAAVGNEGWAIAEYPAAYPDVISVGATEGVRLARYSNRGDWVKFAVPSCIPTTQLGGGFGPGCATSGASPFVAGIAALLRARAPFATVGQIESALARTARPVAGTRFGLVDAYAALQELGQPAPHFDPTIGGSPRPGSSLGAYTGVWAGGGLSPAYAWQRCVRARCVPVGTGRTYRVRASDGGGRLLVSISAPGVAAAVSPRTALVPLRPSNTMRPSVTGRARVGKVVRTSRGSWSGTTLSLAARWIRCRSDSCARGTVIADGWRYRVRAADRGRRLRVVVTAANGLGSASATSTPTARVR